MPVACHSRRLGAALASQITAKTDANVLVGTLGLCAFGDLTQKRKSSAKDSPKAVRRMRLAGRHGKPSSRAGVTER